MSAQLASGPIEPAPRWRYPGWALGLIALLATAAAFVTFFHLPLGAGTRHPGPLAVVIVAVAVLGAGVAVRWPLPGALVVAAALGAYVGRAYPNGPIYAAGLVAMFLVGRRVGRAQILAAVAGLEAALLCGWAVSRHGGALVAFYPGWTAAAAAIGAALRNRRRYLQEHAARAAGQERARIEEALREVAEQRLEIARDLHDGVAHAMATINVQAAAAARVVDRQPAAAKDALGAIARASGTVLDELNAMLTLLRNSREPAALAPAPGLAELEALAASVRAAGRRCELDVTGDPAAVRPPLARAAYRIVQESITNVLKHSQAQRVRVEVRVTDAEFTVTVADDGGPTAAPAEGNGIRGMRERAATTGGALTVSPGRAGLVVRSVWPVAS